MTRPRRIRRPSYKTLENAELARASWKRRRDLLGRRSPKATRVEVVVPTLRQVDARHKSAANAHDSQERPQVKSEVEDARARLLLQDRINVQVKPEEPISENDVRHRLTLIGYHTAFDIKIPRDILETTTTRTVTSRIWGGNQRETLPRISREFTHGLDDFMYLSLLYDPHAPRWPGSPGLVFRFRDDGQEWPKIMRLIVRVRNNVWQYMGQYKLTAAPPLTINEWNAQSHKVKRKWAYKLSQMKFDGGLRARLVLQERLGRDPTPKELEIALKSEEKFEVSAREILQACSEGRTVVRVWCMKCVGYDVDFQRRIAAGT